MGLLIVDDGCTVRLDGVSRGAVIINKHSRGYRLRLTEREGGEFVVDRVYPAGSPLGKRLKRAFWVVRDANRIAVGTLSRVFA